ncbi:MAG: hypothetical protein K5853_03820, partial [Lachnospiraceae bacterium]|nr:hypothetical protein [Lachnospiraceae bacterium]
MSMEIGTKVWQANNPYMPTKTDHPAVDENKKSDETIKKDVNDKSELGAVYERSESAGTVTKKATYDIAKKSPADRAAIVEQMKKAADDQRQSLIQMVEKMLHTQAGKAKTANSPLMSGTVTEEARRKAAEDISEDGYWGVKQTSQRLFDFASALAGDDVEKMKKMQDAMNKGIGQAAAKLGGLPSIGQQTQDAANALFKEYYESKG